MSSTTSVFHPSIPHIPLPVLLDEHELNIMGSFPQQEQHPRFAFQPGL